MRMQIVLNTSAYGVWVDGGFKGRLLFANKTHSSSALIVIASRGDG